MSSHNSYLAFLLPVFLKLCLVQTTLCSSTYNVTLSSYQDTLDLKRFLYNGRVWRDIYSHKVVGDEYLYSRDFLPGAVTFNSRSFKNLKLKYDILNDEILILTYQGNILQLNKEMVGNFVLEYEHINHYFENLESDSTDLPKGYVEILYKGNTTLYVKHIKVISRLAQGKPYDSFEEASRVYFLKDGKIHRISTKKELISLLDDKQEQVRTFIRTHKIKVSKKIPESFVPVLRFYDSISP
jgi:hypothetical protein